MKEELEIYKAVGKAETLKELADVIRSNADSNGKIKGRNRDFNAEDMANFCERFEEVSANTLTRSFGIRQQALYILYYEGHLIKTDKL